MTRNYEQCHHQDRDGKACAKRADYYLIGMDPHSYQLACEDHVLELRQVYDGMAELPREVETRSSVLNFLTQPHFGDAQIPVLA